jgi:hypothetical protein
VGHRIDTIGRLFSGVQYQTKPTAELREAMTRKVEALTRKIAVREQRMVAIRTEYGIDAERLATLVMRYQNDSSFTSYDNQGTPDQPLVPAGVIANLIQEREMIDNETEQIDKLELVLRNLQDEEVFLVTGTGEVKTQPAVHTLTDHELRYLGF